MFYKHIPLKVVIDSGAKTNMIRESVAKQLGASVQTSSHRALQADGQSSLIVTDETSITFNCGKQSFILEALVVSNLECDVLAGVPFMIHNDTSVRPSKRLVLVGDENVCEYHHQSKSSSAHSINYVAAHILRVSSRTTIWSGEFIEVNIPPGLPGDTEMALEPRSFGRILSGSRLMLVECLVALEALGTDLIYFVVELLTVSAGTNTSDSCPK